MKITKWLITRIDECRSVLLRFMSELKISLNLITLSSGLDTGGDPNSKTIKFYFFIQERLSTLM